MIRETIVTTQGKDGTVHIAPMGPHEQGDQIILMPFKPSTTLDNILETRTAVVNYTDDVRIFAGCLTGRKQWPRSKAIKVTGEYITDSLAHAELELVRVEDDKLRPKLFCKVVEEIIHAPFRGFNRAQFAVIEAAILVSRLNRLSWRKIEAEIDYLKIGVDKTAGEREREAWQWLMQAIKDYKNKNPEKVDA